ncbi:hypothetical protein BMF94_0032 [Rhodotorula taiwanensis]|uniref:Protein-tyrosine-phosphatase n=1 Tax=Rhodotorula taiwanensis TaxID=741276 RepID=A0A2S5BJ41_9BASI|nr:hypothetical protein BMF94_0032 [Rhodotorula taiwanensis]
MASASSRSSTPAFLKPTRESLSDILMTLQEREQQRRLAAQRARLFRGTAATHAGGKAAQCDGKEEVDGSGGDWFSVAAGTQPDNVNKNRYADIIAYDRTRIVRPREEGSPLDGSSSGYVNASLVREPDLVLDEDTLPRQWWVAAQAPIASTIHDFLSLLLHPPSSPSCSRALPPIQLVVQLTPLVEGRRSKCHPYFPDQVGDTALVQPSSSSTQERGIWIRLESKEEKDGARESKLRLGYEGDERGRQVTHLEYLGWRDHGVPESAPHLLRFIQRVHALNRRLTTEDGVTSGSASSQRSPILLHCSAGVGRTGTFIAISSLLPLLELEARGPLEARPSKVDFHPLGPYPLETILRADGRRESSADFVGATIDGLRDQRTTMAQTSEQVAWVYECLREAWRTGLYRSPQ